MMKMSGNRLLVFVVIAALCVVGHSALLAFEKADAELLMNRMKGDERSQAEAYLEIKNIGRPVRPMLTTLLAEAKDSPTAKEKVIRLMGEMHDVSGVAPLEDILLHDESEQCRIMSAKALGRIGRVQY